MRAESDLPYVGTLTGLAEPWSAGNGQDCGCEHLHLERPLWEKGMEPMSSEIGLIVIVVLYIIIGVMAAIGSVYIARAIFGAKMEQIFFGLFLIPIAGFYLAFTAYFGDKDAWHLEGTAVVVFTVLGLLGTRFTFALIAGYVLHGVWDALHEINAHAGISLLAWQTTSVPLAYGFFCAAFDFVIAGYFYTRGNH